jgi:hypothetical protein
MMKNLALAIAPTFIVWLVTLWWIIIACAVYNMDSDFDYRQKKHQDLMELCEMIGSSPRSYDHSDLTCVNGLVIDYTTGGK